MLVDVVLVTAGVSGVGKTAVGERLAARLGYGFEDADAFHHEANRRRMAGGEPLTEEHREPWLDALVRAIEGWLEGGRDVVLACSALRRAHRERLLVDPRRVRMVLLEAPAPEIARRLRGRSGHFMPAELLRSQLETLERPARDEPTLSVDASGDIEATVERVLAALSSDAAVREGGRPGSR